MKKSALLALGGALLFTHTASADPYTLVFTSTVSTLGTLPDGVNVGDSFELFVVVDNGGTTDISQTWTYADILAVAASTNGGSYIAFFPGDEFLDGTTAGDIQTDAAGIVSSSTADWVATIGPGYPDSNGDDLAGWRINNSNDIIFSTLSGVSIGSPGDTSSASLWTVSDGDTSPPPPDPPPEPPTPESAISVPTMSAWALAGTAAAVGLIGGFARKRKRRK